MLQRPTDMERVIGDRFVKGKFVTQEGLDKALQELEAGTASSLREALVRSSSGMLTEKTFATMLAFWKNVLAVDLSKVTPDQRALAFIPKEDARRLRILPFSIVQEGEGNVLAVAMDMPEPEVMGELVRISGMRVKSYVPFSGAITDEILEEYYGKRG